MAGVKKFDFYAGKPRTLPRFVYRRLEEALRADPASPSARAQAIAAAAAELRAGASPDYKKFKFAVPGFLKAALTPAELEQLRGETASQRQRAGEMKLAFPHVSDEFSLDAEFLASVFDLESGPKLKQKARFFTIGSCFARNIANFMSTNGHDAKAFEMSEDLNSPISNAFLLGLLEEPPQAQLATLERWRRSIFPEAADAEHRAASAAKHEVVQDLARQLKGADCIVLTLGNVVDFFRTDAAQGGPLLEKVLPKFVAMSPSEDVGVRTSVASLLRSRGAALRLASYAETLEAIAGCIKGIRAQTAAPIVVTVSPVPIDSVIGLTGSQMRSAVEVDCVSKSRLRSAFDEYMLAARERDPQLYYFPSFEIVRWIAPLLPIPSFGLDDAASRHVSSPVLEGICTLFLRNYVKLAANQDGDGAAARPAAAAPKVSYSFTLGKSPRTP
jgi:hypothetical protein